jgi:hypothetical protein
MLTASWAFAAAWTNGSGSWEQLRGGEPTDANREVNKPGRLTGRRISLRFATPTCEPFHDRDNSGEDVIFHIELPTGCRYR